MMVEVLQSHPNQNAGQTNSSREASHSSMALYDLHICRQLPTGYVLSLFPTAVERQGSGVEKIPYRQLEDLIAGLKLLRVSDDTIDNMCQFVKERTAFTISTVSATADDLAGLVPSA